MLQMERQVRSVQSELVVTMRTIQRLAQVAADDVLIAKLGTNGRPSTNPIEIAVQVDSKDIGAVVVERHLALVAAYEFKPVVRTVPVDGGLEVQLVGLAACLIQLATHITLQGRIEFGSFLILLVVLRAIECVRSPALSRETRLPGYFKRGRRNEKGGRSIASLIESLYALIVAVQSPCLRTLVAV